MFKSYVQIVAHYGVLIYGTTKKTTVQQMETKIEQVTQIVFRTKPWQSSVSEHEEHKFF